MDGRPIVVVDDDQDWWGLVAEVLELEGYPVITAEDGEQALELIARGRPSLVVTDLHMPNVDGPALASALHERGLDPPILVLSGTSRDPIQAAKAVHGDACLVKPFSIEDLLTMVAILRIP